MPQEKIKILIIDDEKRAINILKILLERHIPDFLDIHSTTSSIEGLKLISELKVDLVFLDIDMPEISGIELLEKTTHLDYEVIMTTAYSEYAIQAFRLSAIDYLLKPIELEELKEAMLRFKNKTNLVKEREEQMKSFKQNLTQEDSFHTLAVSSVDGTLFIPLDEIIRCEASNNYTFIYSHKRKRLLAAKTLKDYELALESKGFIRVHKTHLVNRKHISELHGSTLILSTKESIPIARRRVGMVKMLLK